MREFLVQYGADGWRDWTTVFAENADDALAFVKENYPDARWGMVEDDVTGLTDDVVA